MNPQKMIDNFSTHLKNTIARSISLSSYLESKNVQPIHLLASLAAEEGSVAAEILKKLKMTHKSLLKYISGSEHINLKNQKSITDSDLLPELSNGSRTVLEKALLLAYDRSHNYIGTEHLLYGLITSGNKKIRECFVAHKIEYKTIETHVESLLENTSKFSSMDEISATIDEMQELGEMPPAMPQMPPSQMHRPAGSQHQNALDHFTVNLTDKKLQKTIDPVVGRESEIDRIINILGRRTKNNPILVGEPGVGKTAIIEGLAKRISTGDIPDTLKRKKVLALDLTLLISGTIYRGEFEARLKQIIDEVKGRDDCILFIDELHNIIGAGSNQGTLDAANILKPALARGQLRCVGATTLDEYKKYIASDPALERRFETVQIDEPSTTETIQILQGVKKYYENFHHVSISAQAIKKAVELSNKYIHDTYQPDKSLDLIDEASSAVHGKQKFSASKEKFENLKEEILDLQSEKENAIDDERLQEALNIKEKIEKLDKKLKILEKQLKKQKAPTKLKVKEKDIAQALGSKLDIELDILLSNDWENLQTLERRIKKHIIGQDKAVKKVVQNLQKAHIGVGRKNKPFASFMFVGPSGVGKTELAKTLARELYHDNKSLIKLDMSEFSEAHSVSKILGAPAGYVGHKERNKFLEQVKNRPYSVILFDEIDKAHADVRKLLLSILDEGELTDSDGKKIHFNHSVVILTTNSGAEIFKSAGIGFGNQEINKNGKTEIENQIISTIKQDLGSSILSRINTVCLFYPLSKENLAKIAKQYFSEINKQLTKSKNISIAADKKAIESIIELGYSQDLGARNLESAVHDVLNELIVDILSETRETKQKFKLTKQKNLFKLV